MHASAAQKRQATEWVEAPRGKASRSETDESAGAAGRRAALEADTARSEPNQLSEGSASPHSGDHWDSAGTRPRKWTAAEDSALRSAVAEFGERRWKTIAERVPGRDHVQCLQRWRKALQPGLKKGHWSREEDEILKSEVACRPRNWGDVAIHIPGRTAKQCRERWSNHLDPSIKRSAWTAEEDALLERLVDAIGSKWASISRKLPGRTENAVKIRAKSLERQRRRGERARSPSMTSATAAAAVAMSSDGPRGHSRPGFAAGVGPSPEAHGYGGHPAFAHGAAHLSAGDSLAPVHPASGAVLPMTSPGGMGSSGALSPPRPEWAGTSQHPQLLGRGVSGPASWHGGALAPPFVHTGAHGHWPPAQSGPSGPDVPTPRTLYSNVSSPGQAQPGMATVGGEGAPPVSYSLAPHPQQLSASAALSAAASRGQPASSGAMAARYSPDGPTPRLAVAPIPASEAFLVGDMPEASRYGPHGLTVEHYAAYPTHRSAPSDQSMGAWSSFPASSPPGAPSAFGGQHSGYGVDPSGAAHHAWAQQQQQQQQQLMAQQMHHHQRMHDQQQMQLYHHHQQQQHQHQQQLRHQMLLRHASHGSADCATPAQDATGRPVFSGLEGPGAAPASSVSGQAPWAPRTFADGHGGSGPLSSVSSNGWGHGGGGGGGFAPTAGLRGAIGSAGGPRASSVAGRDQPLMPCGHNLSGASERAGSVAETAARAAPDSVGSSMHSADETSAAGCAPTMAGPAAAASGHPLAVARGVSSRSDAEATLGLTGANAVPPIMVLRGFSAAKPGSQFEPLPMVSAKGAEPSAPETPRIPGPSEAAVRQSRAALDCASAGKAVIVPAVVLPSPSGSAMRA
ncbi:hypothetical protein FNF28_00325 [Cafeteria roenbergensis]|uniref:Uncharacterized protein n=1 Tax=Cafeteria roenbergensis TaxID=33653 RepID=A0A5A8E3S9_CAFRO|nr:hypothetical protein FNF28_00325 [Cafeteria roenbergensis]